MELISASSQESMQISDDVVFTASSISPPVQYTSNTLSKTAVTSHAYLKGKNKGKLVRAKCNM